MFIETLVNYINLMDENNVFANIAEYIIRHTEAVVHMKLDELADACYVSPATISRFCRFFGLDNFTELRLACRKELDMGAWRKDIVLQPAKGYENLYEQFNNFAKIVGDKLEQVAKNLNTDEIKWLVEKIAETDEVVFVDLGYALPFAQDLQRVLALSNKLVYCHTRTEQQIECVQKLGEDSLAVAFFVDLGFNTPSKPVSEALEKVNCGKILVTAHKIQEDDNFEKVICIDASDQPGDEKASTYCMMYFINALMSAWYQRR